MSDDIATAQEGVDATENAEPNEAPEAEPNEAEEVDDADDAEPEGDEGEDNEEAEEEVEYDLGGGQKLKVKANATAKEVLETAQKAFKEVEASYTRKSQAVAEQAKSIAARAEAVQKLETLNGEALSEYSKGLQIKAELDRLNAVDLNAVWQSNPDQARMLSDRKAMLASEFNAVVNRVSQIEGTMTQAQQAEMARIESEGEALLEKRIKGFSQKVPEVVKYVSENYGIDAKHAESVWKRDPATAEMAFKAMMYDRMQAKAAKPQPKLSNAKPIAPVKGAASAKTADPARMTEAQMARHLGLPVR